MRRHAGALPTKAQALWLPPPGVQPPPPPGVQGQGGGAPEPQLESLMVLGMLSQGGRMRVTLPLLAIAGVHPPLLGSGRGRLQVGLMDVFGSMLVALSRATSEGQHIPPPSPVGQDLSTSLSSPQPTALRGPEVDCQPGAGVGSRLRGPSGVGQGEGSHPASDPPGGRWQCAAMWWSATQR